MRSKNPAQLLVKSQTQSPKSRSSSPTIALREVKDRLREFQSSRNTRNTDIGFESQDKRRDSWSTSCSEKSESDRKKYSRPPWNDSQNEMPSQLETARKERLFSPRRENPDSKFQNREIMSYSKRGSAPLRSRPGSSKSNFEYNTRSNLQGNSRSAPLICRTQSPSKIFSREHSPRSIRNEKPSMIADIDARLRTLQDFLRAAKKAWLCSNGVK